jgi:polysaccharide pyruvyl transferase WcaK-like protein
MRQRGVDTEDSVFPDLAFALPLPTNHRNAAGDWSTIGVGVMAYVGSNDDRDRAREIYDRYVDSVKEIVRWLIDNGRRVRLFIGDTDGSDEATVRQILADMRALRPELDESWIVLEPVSTFSEIMEALEPLGAMVATRFHNLVASVMLSKPTIAVGYSSKHSALMSDMGLAEFSYSIEALDVGALKEQFLEMERCSEQLRQSLSARTAEKAALLERQFDELDVVVFGRDTAARHDIASVPAS